MGNLTSSNYDPVHRMRDLLAPMGTPSRPDAPLSLPTIRHYTSERRKKFTEEVSFVFLGLDLNSKSDLNKAMDNIRNAIHRRKSNSHAFNIPDIVTTNKRQTDELSRLAELENDAELRILHFIGSNFQSYIARYDHLKKPVFSKFVSLIRRLHSTDDIFTLEALKQSRLAERASIRSEIEKSTGTDDESRTRNAALRKRLQRLNNEILKITDTISYIKWYFQIQRLDEAVESSGDNFPLRREKFQHLTRELKRLPPTSRQPILADLVSERKQKQVRLRYRLNGLKYGEPHEVLIAKQNGEIERLKMLDALLQKEISILEKLLRNRTEDDWEIVKQQPVQPSVDS